MHNNLHLLQTDDLPGEIAIHSDPLSIMPSALSRKRALKVGSAAQVRMDDPKGPQRCILCDPTQKPKGTSTHQVLIRDRVAYFENDFPYLPGDQQVVFLWHSDQKVRESCLHRFELSDFGKTELYWLVRGCFELGNKYEVPDTTLNLMRMVVGFNLGKLAGQSIPHFHAQYGWEVVLDKRAITSKKLAAYFEELESKELIIFQDERVKVVAPWTPKGQFALELYFNDKFDILEMDDHDFRILACVGNRIIKKYLHLGIENLNIVFNNSPSSKRTLPLVAHFVPRVNMTALYEIKGVNVVDTPPQKIAEEFRRSSNIAGDEPINWPNLVAQAAEFSPDDEFEMEVQSAAFTDEEPKPTKTTRKRKDQGVETAKS